MLSPTPLPKWPPFDPSNPSPYFVSAAQIYNAWIRRKVSVPFAIAMVTMAELESGFKVGAIGDRGMAYSIMQWWWIPRGAAILKATGIDVRTETSIDKIVEAAFWEMNGPLHHARDVIAAAKNAADAARAASLLYEGASGAAISGATVDERRAAEADRRAKEATRWTVFLADNRAWVEAQG